MSWLVSVGARKLDPARPDVRSQVRPFTVKRQHETALLSRVVRAMRAVKATRCCPPCCPRDFANSLTDASTGRTEFGNKSRGGTRTGSMERRALRDCRFRCQARLDGPNRGSSTEPVSACERPRRGHRAGRSVPRGRIGVHLSEPRAGRAGCPTGGCSGSCRLGWT